MIRFINTLIIVFFCHTCFAVTTRLDQCQNNRVFNIGAGIYDITGPAAEEGMMGYGMIQQKTSGIYQRLWARAFVIESPCNQKRVVFVNADLGQLFQGVKQQVIKKLQEKYGDQYSDDNVLITAIHTHSGPGGYSTYIFYNITTLGFSQKNFDTIVNGIVAAIERAQVNMKPAHIKIASGRLTGISYNRSPQSYLQNPIEERNRYAADIDTEMTLVRFDTLQGKPIGTINWFPIHGTAMNNKNGLINGDNKGYAEYLFEKEMQSNYNLTDFVAAFAQTNAGDVSPNPYGHEGGNGDEGIKNITRAGKPQYETAKRLYDQAAEWVTGGVDYRHSFVDMGHVPVAANYTDGKPQMTCPAAIGVSMLAGTQDGEGIGWQGVTCDTLRRILPSFICDITTTHCQGAKPIVAATGTMKPRPWTPQILPMQVVKIGNLMIGAAPMELTTMTGRRIKQAIKDQLPAATTNHVVLSALANAYAGYVTTEQEYGLQRYEGASTHFGPWTAAALQQLFSSLTRSLINNEKVEAGPQPPDYLTYQVDLQTDVLFDSVPIGKKFGDVKQNVNAVYEPGDTVQVIFWGAHPKNNYRIQGTFLEVQKLMGNKWETIRTDQDADTEYHWQRDGVANSLITTVWHIPSDMPTGQYRIVHYGDSKSFWGHVITPYSGNSEVFKIMRKPFMQIH